MIKITCKTNKTTFIYYVLYCIIILFNSIPLAWCGLETEEMQQEYLINPMPPSDNNKMTIPTLIKQMNSLKELLQTDGVLLESGVYDMVIRYGFHPVGNNSPYVKCFHCDKYLKIIKNDNIENIIQTSDSWHKEGCAFRYTDSRNRIPVLSKKGWAKLYEITSNLNTINIISAEEHMEYYETIQIPLLDKDYDKNIQKEKETSIKHANYTILSEYEETTDDTQISSDTNTYYDYSKKINIQYENNKIREELKCKVCKQKSIKKVLIPCGHFAICGDCNSIIERCPVCNQDIENTITVNDFIP